jgi:hypothetical protein
MRIAMSAVDMKIGTFLTDLRRPTAMSSGWMFFGVPRWRLPGSWSVPNRT